MWRFRFLVLGLSILACALIARVIYLTISDRHFLMQQGNARFLRVTDIPAYRGMILDRNQNPLAVSTPVYSIWVNPHDFLDSTANINCIAKILHINASVIRQKLYQHAKREFLYIERNVNPLVAKRIRALSIPGIYLEQNYKRYYPNAEVVAHVVGFTNIDGKGQEGIELAYEDWLRGVPGKQQVLQDRYKHMVAMLGTVRAAQPGHDVVLSIDNRIQFLAYRVLKNTVEEYDAESGSVVVLNPKTGEVLAMVNQPAYNPNNIPARGMAQFRNRAVTDLFEPGSTMKAFSIASALDSGKYTANSTVRTSPGFFKVGHNIVRDEHDQGVLTVTQILQKSSNVGVAKMTLSLPSEHLVDLLRRIGFGERTQSGFPGESAGSIVYYQQWHPFDLATLAFGYGISVTPLQLAHAYGVLADGGLKCPISFLKREEPDTIRCPRVMDASVADEMLHMLEQVLQPEGTGGRARIEGYRVAGKTGTAYIAAKHGYSKTDYVSSFVGIAPVQDPQLVVAVVIRKPRLRHYGAVVAAPAFAKVMGGALRILNIPPDEK